MPRKKGRKPKVIKIKVPIAPDKTGGEGEEPTSLVPFTMTGDFDVVTPTMMAPVRKKRRTFGLLPWLLLEQ